MYGKFVDFYDAYFKIHINDELWLEDSVKVFTLSVYEY